MKYIRKVNDQEEIFEGSAQDIIALLKEIDKEEIDYLIEIDPNDLGRS